MPILSIYSPSPSTIRGNYDVERDSVREQLQRDTSFREKMERVQFINEQEKRSREKPQPEMPLPPSLPALTMQSGLCSKRKENCCPALSSPYSRPVLDAHPSSLDDITT